jgi:putative transcriptional regulator
MKLKKLLLVIEIILAIFLIIGIVYLSYKLYLKVMGIQDYAQVGNREIFYTCGSKYGDATIYENGLMIIKDGMKEKAKINLSKDEIKELRESTGMNRKEFCEYFGIPYRTVTEWERGTRKMPDYVFRLLAYRIKMEKFAGKEEVNEE